MASMNSRDEFARDRNGRIITDRFGRPVRRRPATPPADGQPAPRRQPRREIPRQDIPRREVPPAAEPPRYVSAPPQYSQPPQYGQPQYGQPQYGQPSGPGAVGGRSDFARPQRPPRQAPPRQTPPRHTPPTRAPRGGRRRRRGGVGIKKIVSLILVVLLAVTLCTAVWVDTNLQRTDALADYEGRPGGSIGATNWLLVGSDSRAGLNAEDADRLMAGELGDTTSRTDTIMVVHVPMFGKATMLSIPRDSYVNIPGQGESKINEAFTIGGPQLLQQTVEQATGIHIDRYAEIGFGGFANVVDAMGDINICVPEPLDDPMAGINLQAGCQDMDGPTALGYVRSRYASANGDLDRVERQRQFLNAMSDKLMSFGTIANPFRLFPVIDALSKSLTVNEGDHVWNLGKLALGMTGGVNQETVPIAGYQDTYSGNVALWDEAAAEQVFEKLR